MFLNEEEVLRVGSGDWSKIEETSHDCWKKTWNCRNWHRKISMHLSQLI